MDAEDAFVLSSDKLLFKLVRLSQIIISYNRILEIHESNKIIEVNI